MLGAVKISYGRHPSQFAELTVPSGGRKLPVAVVVHGGFWRSRYGLELGRPLAMDLADKGWAVLNVEYRRVGTRAACGGWPATCLDVAAAVDSLSDQAARLAPGRLDLDRVVAIGHSAGGHLAGWLAGRPRLPVGSPGADPRVRLVGVVAQAGILDLVSAATAGLGRRAVLTLMRAAPSERPDDYELASPISRVPFGIPSVCVHGTKDHVVPIWQSEAFVKAARLAGDPSELRRFDGDHYDVITVGTPAWKMCVEALARLSAKR